MMLRFYLAMQLHIVWQFNNFLSVIAPICEDSENLAAPRNLSLRIVISKANLIA